MIVRLASRHQALIELGMINDPDDAPRFARDLWVPIEHLDKIVDYFTQCTTVTGGAGGNFS